MFYKILCVVFLSCVILTQGHGYSYSSNKIIRHDGHHEPVYVHGHDGPIDYYAYPKYEIEYKVEDEHTGNKQSREGFRDGDVVKGTYSLQEPDGSVRTVDYGSDDHSGFHADVSYSTHHIIPKHHS